MDLVWAATAAKEAHASHVERPVSCGAYSAYSAGEAAEEADEGEEQGLVDARDRPSYQSRPVTPSRRPPALHRGKKGPRTDSK
eukprot:465580-Amphidinium_carterae.1